MSETLYSGVKLRMGDICLYMLCSFYEFAQSIDCVAHSIDSYRLGNNI